MPGRCVSAPPLVTQLYHLRALGLANASGTLLERRTKLRFDFCVRPTLISREYSCRIQLSTGGYNPEAWVLNPDLQQLADGARPPHIYDLVNGKTQLCLFYPQSNEWTTQSWLAKTMVPWTISWLRFFEIWQNTGKWEGGGEHPSAEPTSPRRRFGIAARRA